MFLRQLYTQHKGWFLLVCFFIAGQLFINYKHGMTFTPFHHYGMFSERFEVKDTIKTVDIELNGKLLSPADLSSIEWSKLTNYPYLENILDCHNQLYAYPEHLYQVLHISPVKQNFVYNPGCAAFYHWYTGYIQAITGQPVESLKVTLNQYVKEKGQYRIVHQFPFYPCP